MTKPPALPAPATPEVPFAHYAGAKKPRLLLVGEAWGEKEDLHRAPFVGHSGKELFRMLCDAGVAPGASRDRVKKCLFAGDELFLALREEWLQEAQIGLTNVFAYRPGGNKLEAMCGADGKGLLRKGRPLAPLLRSPKHQYMRPEYLPNLDRLEAEVRDASPACVVALGAAALWGLGAALGPSLAAPGSHSEVRGTLLPGPPKTLPTFHPAYVLRMWSARSITVADLIKAWRESESPAFVRPSRRVIISPELSDIEEWTANLFRSPPPVLSCDIETKGGEITSIGFGTARDAALVIPFVLVGETTFRSYWRSASDELAAWKFVRRILATPCKKLFQNGLYDIQWLLRRQCTIRGASEDTMLLHHAIHPEMRKGLGFLGSLYTSEPAWKLMRRRGKDEGEKAEE